MFGCAEKYTLRTAHSALQLYNHKNDSCAGVHFYLQSRYRKLLIANKSKKASRYSVLARQQNFERFPALITTLLINEGTVKAKFQRLFVIYHCVRRARNGVFGLKSTLAFWSKEKLLISKSVKYFYAGIEENIARIANAVQVTI